LSCLACARMLSESSACGSFFFLDLPRIYVASSSCGEGTKCQIKQIEKAHIEGRQKNVAEYGCNKKASTYLKRIRRVQLRMNTI
jgi:hypothetical protein